MENNVHQRVLKLRDAALGSRKSISVSSSLARVSYECVVDSLLALYTECSSERAGLARDKHIARFLTKYQEAVKDLNQLRLTPEDFSVKAVIGRGHFGEVQVVHEKSTGDVYAMKVMRKSHILQQADAAFFLEERDIMAWANSPWLTSLHYAFQDSNHLYLVMDFHPGGDLLSVMERNEGGMTEVDVRFYLSEIATGLHDLHELGFVHRDIKPENVLITRSGHIKLVDFGSAARLGPQGKVLESRLPVGTPEYIAPEVLTSLDHTAAEYGVCCDWWSLGIIAYELIYDVMPFTGGSTAETYSNIMNYEKSLSFPDGVDISDSLRDLVCQLLTTPTSRLTFPGVQAHPFFSSVDWTRLQQTMPPYIPSVYTPDDTTNFDEFEPQSDLGVEELSTPQSHRGQRGFSGQTLPFIGFTFTRMDSMNLDLTETEDVSEGGGVVRRSSDRGGRGRGRGRGLKRGLVGAGETQEVSDLKRQLEASQKELKELRERKTSLERECVIYQSQLEDFHRKLEIEKVERRHSDGQALQLLEEVREQGKIAQQLRESEARSKCEQLSNVIEQLEQERGVASKRARRLQEELQRVQEERDVAVKKISDYKSKVTEVKQNSRKDISSLQTKLAKVTKDSLAKVAEMQNRLTEAHTRFSESSKRVQEVESEKRKLEFSLQQAQLDGSISSSEAARDMTKKLEEAEDARTKAEKEVGDLKHQIEMKNQENSSLHSQCKQLSHQVKELETQWQSANSRQERLEAAEWDLKTRLGEVSREKEEAVTATKQVQKCLSNLEKVLSQLQSDKQCLEDQLKVYQQSSVTTSVAVKQEHEEREVLQAQLTDRERELKEVQTQLEGLKKSDMEVQSQLRENMRSVQAQLSETSNLYIAQGDKLREVRRARMELDQEHTNLKTELSRTKSEVKKWKRKFEEASEELDRLSEVRQMTKNLKKEIASLTNHNKDMKRDLEISQSQKEEAVIARQEIEVILRNTKKEMEVQELNMTLLQKKLSSVEEELSEVRGMMDEERGREEKWRESRNQLQTDLKIAEKSVEGAYAEVEKEKGLRASLEQNLTDTLASLEKTAEAHREEQQRLAEQLATQKQLASKYSDRVSHLEKEGRLRGLEFREMQKELETEKSLSSKLYDDLHSLGREHGKLKAAHLKMLRESSQKETQLSQEAAAREQAMEQQRVAAETHMIQETKLQATIAQQSKLIDFLQKPSRGSRLKLKGFKLSRKSRDPAKEIAEWKKIKGLAAKPTSKGVASDVSSGTPSLQRITSSCSSTLPSLHSSSSQTSLVSTTSAASPQLSTPPNTNVIHLPSTQHQQVDTTSESEATIQSTPHSTGGSPDINIKTTPTGTPLMSPSQRQLMVKRLSVDIHRKQTEIAAQDVTSKKSGKKRGLEVSSSASSVAQRPSSRLGIDHNIPHKFVLKSAPLHKSYTCFFCKSTIKAMQKFVKCSYCGKTCHPKCSDQIPNNCGLPAELVDFDLSRPSSAKKLKWEADKEEEGRQEERGDKRGEQASGRSGGVVKSVSLIRRRDETIKMGRVFVQKGELKSECWLVLTDSSLKCYDRHPAGVTRKPLNSFSWADPKNLVVVLQRVDSRPISYMSQTKNQHLLFAVEQHSVVGVQRGVFIATSLEEKKEWTAAIESAITKESALPQKSSGVNVTPVQSSSRPSTRPATVCTTSSLDSSVV